MQKVSTQLKTPPTILEDRLYLNAVSGAPAFRPLFDALLRMGFYNINPAEIREPQPHLPGMILAGSGYNLPSVLKRLKDESPETLERVADYLRRIVPGIEGVEHYQMGSRETVRFRQEVEGQKHSWRFDAAAMSDGTLRSLGVLTALFQFVGSLYGPVPIVAIEEPESTVHPAAAATIMDAMLEAAKRGQIIATTHSPDLLDHGSLDPEQLIAVTKKGGETLLAPVDTASISAVKNELYTAGELLRQNQLHAAPAAQDKALRQSDHV